MLITLLPFCRICLKREEKLNSSLACREKIDEALVSAWHSELIRIIETQLCSPSKMDTFGSKTTCLGMGATLPCLHRSSPQSRMLPPQRRRRQQLQQQHSNHRRRSRCRYVRRVELQFTQEPSPTNASAAILPQEQPGPPGANGAPGRDGSPGKKGTPVSIL